MDMEYIYKSIKSLKNRMHLNNAVLSLMWGLAAASGTAFFLACLSLFVPVPFVMRILAGVYLFAVLLSLTAALFLRPGNLAVIKAADALGLKERLITAYELKDDGSPLSRVQRYDALKAASQTNFKALYAIKFPKYQGLACVVLALLTLLCLALPSGAREKAAGMENLANEVKKQAENIDKERKELSKKAILSDKKLQEINQRIDQLLKELKKADTEAKAVKALAKTKHELEELQNKGVSSELKQLGERLSESPATRDFGEALKNGNLADMKQKLEQLNNRLKNLSPEGKKELAQKFEQAARELANSPELAQNLADLSQALASGDLSSLGSHMASLENTLSQLARSDSALAQAMQQYENEVLQQLSNSLDSARQQISSQGGQGSSTAQGGENPGQGTGSGPSNKGGGGAGDQSSNRDLGYSGDESGGGARMPGQEKKKDYEGIYAPSRLGGDSSASQVKGSKGGAGQSQWSEAEGAPVQKGNTVPYDQVLGEYKSEAMQSLEGSSIPPVMQDMVRDYFSSLE
ncbi:MAG: hypothetical protein QHH06_14265 [Clostridiales bacterium]|nr:hypothetical protein [Eubacteriales bacterium]MDH7567607.1 hypothetical protein [Clostridiales bacterium]